MRFSLTEPSYLETDGFNKNDIFDHLELGEGLANLVSDTKGPLGVTKFQPNASRKASPT